MHVSRIQLQLNLKFALINGVWLSEIDECSSNPNCGHGNCSNELNAYVCVCDTGYTGVDCSEEIDDCLSNPCLNGQCIDAFDAYSCACTDGYTDDQCTTEIDECSSNPSCGYGGYCIDLMNAYECYCPDGYIGDSCASEIDECDSNPCVNGTCTDALDSYTCACQDGFAGAECHLERDECASNPHCGSGVCVDSFNAYSCSCDDGFTGPECDIIPSGNTHVLPPQHCQSVIYACNDELLVTSPIRYVTKNLLNTRLLATINFTLQYWRSTKYADGRSTQCRTPVKAPRGTRLGTAARTTTRHWSSLTHRKSSIGWSPHTIQG